VFLSSVDLFFSFMIYFFSRRHRSVSTGNILVGGNAAPLPVVLLRPSPFVARDPDFEDLSSISGKNRPHK
jgi:hypothetical protein